ncbi:TGF-beta receptor type-2 [Larimichthys crocea]|uniref:receptor protein serine/threonine kinase n=1 Tax=Larimichthys crocea TaxID=215358 RepID=A0A6G0J3U1_LARCR|nr:TGF-beta receptor type-2 [Larimichthys crocea]
MILKQRWLILAVESIFICLSRQSFPQKRQCVFQVTRQNNKYTTAGNVSGSVQLCETTRCCVGYFLIINGQPEVDTLACDIVEKSCPDTTCKAQTRFNGLLIKCVCNTDLCNSNITWTPESEEPRPTYPYAVVKTAGYVMVCLVGLLLVLCFLILAAKWRRHFKEKKKNPLSLDDYSVSQLCSCQTTKTSEIDVANIELQQIVGHGRFATVWRGKYQGSTVAVKVFPAGWKQKFTAEKEVYELPLMKHAGIVNFLGTGRKPDGGSWLIVLQFAKYLGKLRYMPPEILDGSVDLSNTWCLMQGDIYALGLLLWEICMRCTDLFEGGNVPQHLLPYESELGLNVTQESLILHVFHMDKRPSIPQHWGLLPQGSKLQELLTDCWDCDPDARLSAQCVVERLISLQSCYSA